MKEEEIQLEKAIVSTFKRNDGNSGRIRKDNQPIESFWKTIKREMPSIWYMNFDEAKMTIVKYIELYYNSARLHSSIGYQCPNYFYDKLAIYLVY